ncbi:PDZ domain-containing protein [Candidatus Micrarchaeota archaeon]|nr:PDZ domain-containing protein [Candidatus Micrarchaeota archaeon]
MLRALILMMLILPAEPRAAFGEEASGWIGVYIMQVPPETARSLGLGKDQGALVFEVIEAGPADKAGIKDGDIVVEFDGKKIDNWESLADLAAATPVEKEIEVKLLRTGQEITLRLKVAPLPKVIPPRRNRWAMISPDLNPGPRTNQM